MVTRSHRNRNRRVNDQASYAAYCQPCDKQSFARRRDASGTVRRLRREGGTDAAGLRPYRCPAAPAYWHVGHLPEVVRRGETTAAEIFTHPQPEETTRP